MIRAYHQQIKFSDALFGIVDVTCERDLFFDAEVHRKLHEFCRNGPSPITLNTGCPGAAVVDSTFSAIRRNKSTRFTGASLPTIPIVRGGRNFSV